MARRTHKQTTVGAPCMAPAPTAVPETEVGKHPYLQMVVSSTTDAMIALDEHFHILDLNPAMTVALNCSPEEAIGHNCSAILRCRNLNRNTHLSGESVYDDSRRPAKMSGRRGGSAARTSMTTPRAWGTSGQRKSGGTN